MVFRQLLYITEAVPAQCGGELTATSEIQKVASPDYDSSSRLVIMNESATISAVYITILAATTLCSHAIVYILQ